MLKKRIRNKIIPNRIFNKLWIGAEKINNKNQYIQSFTSTFSDDYIDFKNKFGLNYEESLDLLNTIYDTQQMSFKDILNAAEKRKADVANAFCIPIRTIEAWYNGQNPCNGYIRLMLIRQYKLLKPGNYIRFELEEEYKKNHIAIYNKRAIINQTNIFDKNAEEEEDEALLEIDSFLRELEERRKERMKAQSQDSTIKELLEKTSFIDKMGYKNK